MTMRKDCFSKCAAMGGARAGSSRKMLAGIAEKKKDAAADAPAIALTLNDYELTELDAKP